MFFNSAFQTQRTSSVPVSSKKSSTKAPKPSEGHSVAKRFAKSTQHISKQRITHIFVMICKNTMVPGMYTYS